MQIHIDIDTLEEGDSVQLSNTHNYFVVSMKLLNQVHSNVTDKHDLALLRPAKTGWDYVLLSSLNSNLYIKVHYSRASDTRVYADS